jgi:hypothetical protein
VPVRGFVSAAVPGRMLALSRYTSLPASMEVTVVSAESDHGAFYCSDSKCCPTARREERVVASTFCTVLCKRSL